MTPSDWPAYGETLCHACNVHSMTAAWQSEVVADGQLATPTHTKETLAVLPAGTPCMQSPLSCLQCKVAQALSSWSQTTLTCTVSRHSQEQSFYLLSILELLKLKTFSSQRKSLLPWLGCIWITGWVALRVMLCRIYDLYTDYVLKNPFYEVEMPVRCELFDVNLFQVIGTVHRRWGVIQAWKHKHLACSVWQEQTSHFHHLITHGNHVFTTSWHVSQFVCFEKLDVKTAWPKPLYSWLTVHKAYGVSVHSILWLMLVMHVTGGWLL